MNKININLTLSHFEQIYKEGWSLEMIFFLKLLETEEEISSLYSSSPKMKLLHQTMIRKGLITKDDKISVSGKKLLEFIESEDVTPILIIKKAKNNKDDDFEKWWKSYPGTDTFEINNKLFKGTRSLRAKKEECKIKFYNILNEGEYTIDELIKALELEVSQKIENSYKSGVNKLSFMQNSLTYLNQRTFEGFIELVKQGITVQKEEKIIGGIDI